MDELTKIQKRIEAYKRITRGEKMEDETKTKIQYGIIGGVIAFVLMMLLKRKYKLEDVEKIVEQKIKKFRKWFK